MKRPTYDVHLDGYPDPVRVEVHLADQLVAEREAPKVGLTVDPGQHPMATTTLWLWCALRRMATDVGPFGAFQNRLLQGFEPVTETDPETGQEVSPDIPPTLPAAPTL